MHLDPHEKPSEELRRSYKFYQKCDAGKLQHDDHFVDTAVIQNYTALFGEFDWASTTVVENAFQQYLDDSSLNRFGDIQETANTAFRCLRSPGLVVIPNLLPTPVQEAMLAKLLHRDLSNEQHQTNVHFHHDMSYPPGGTSFFSLSKTSSGLLQSKDLAVHKDMTNGQFLSKKLRWITLGGQYDWTAKVYPSQKPPDFPSDHKRLLQDLFPETNPEAAIVNVYSPGDVLSLHRDVAEDCENGLISISIGCDALFMITVDDSDASKTSENMDFVVLRLHSGDALYMTGSSRFAYHGVPQILRNTSPLELVSWPNTTSSYNSHPDWTGWLSSKRINLNVRQMYTRATELSPNKLPES